MTAQIAPYCDRSSTLRKTRSILSNGLFYLLIFGFICIVLGPYLWMVISSISPQIELTATPIHWIPQQPTFDRYLALFYKTGTAGLPAGVENFIRGLINSLVVST